MGYEGMRVTSYILARVQVLRVIRDISLECILVYTRLHSLPGMVH